MALVVKNSPSLSGDVRDVGSISGSGRSPGVGNGDLLHYSCLENSVDREPGKIVWGHKQLDVTGYTHTTAHHTHTHYFILTFYCSHHFRNKKCFFYIKEDKLSCLLSHHGYYGTRIFSAA